MRSKVVAVALICLLSMKTVRSQSDELLVQGQTGNLFLHHTVVAKENWYSIGRLYNLNPKDLAPYNKLVMTQPLSIGQQLQIPLTAANFSQNGVKTAAETLVPLYYVIQEKEWMYRISVNHNKVPIPSLEKWNNINKDQVHPGMHIIVGYLKVKTALSTLATRPSGTTVAATVQKGGDTTQKIAQVTSKPVEKVSTPPPTEKPVVTSPTSTAGVKPAGTGTTSTSTKPAATGTTSTDTKPSATGTEKPISTNTTTTSSTTQSAVTPVSSTGKSFNGGYFKNDFTDGGKSAEGLAGTFKSSSGWQDGKYYALMNNVPVGTIVRVTVSTNGKIIYAKILGQLPDMKESGGLAIRISNAAASELGEGDARFNVSVKY